MSKTTVAEAVAVLEAEGLVPDGAVLEINGTRMSAEEFEIGYSITRHPSAVGERFA
ncbi:hypothetical protein GXW82_25635 [Streptacidiphilus sp. 4-A2]|nr:hypothetical protein [Streptacidiphilus sp. 4-A2]